MDNYSKMILGYAVDERLSFTLIKTALNNALTTILTHEKGNRVFLLLTEEKKITTNRLNSLFLKYEDMY